MNEEHFRKFSDAYHAGLMQAVLEYPEEYAYKGHPAAVENVVNRMLAAIRENPGMVNYNSEGMKRACKTLGIKYTRKAIWEYLGIRK